MASDLPFCDIFAPTKIPLSKFLMTSLHVICGLAPQSKILTTLMSESILVFRSNFVLLGTLPPRVVSRAGLFGSGSGLKLTKISGLFRAWDVLFVLGAQKYNQINLATLMNFPDLTKLAGFFGHDLGFKLVFGFRPGSGLYFRIRAWTSRPVYNSASTLLESEM